ncbi:MAG: hypothetical protein HZY73_08410 [Micropruina sp.]|nr:MAG: hypothetical protein HZY73_08410 [Micropruina sp.]
MAKRERRFTVVHEEGALTVARVLRDTKTGVCYLWYGEGAAYGLTPLLNADGSPVVTWDTMDDGAPRDLR